MKRKFIPWSPFWNSSFLDFILFLIYGRLMFIQVRGKFRTKSYGKVPKGHFFWVDKLMGTQLKSAQFGETVHWRQSNGSIALVCCCFRENVIVTCKIASSLYCLDNFLLKNVIVFIFGNQVIKWLSFEKKVYFWPTFHNFCHQGNNTFVCP